jgi:serine/threonine protein kinase
VVRVGGRFRLDDRAGELSGASLWKGTDELLRRPVAVYLLPPSRPVAAGVVTAVRAAARVSDPRLARVFDADFSPGCPYIVAEWAPGEHVDDLLVTGLLSPALAAAIIAEAADALAVAHDSGLPHLCLVPRSLRWGAGGVKVTGLGVEAALAGAGASDPAGADTRALARILYALLTGYWPGQEATRLPPAPRHRGRLCAPRQVQAGIPAILSAITFRALQPEPGDTGLSTPAQLARELGLRARARPRPAPLGQEAIPRQQPGPRCGNLRWNFGLG